MKEKIYEIKTAKYWNSLTETLLTLEERDSNTLNTEKVVISVKDISDKIFWKVPGIIMVVKWFMIRNFVMPIYLQQTAPLGLAKFRNYNGDLRIAADFPLRHQPTTNEQK